MAVTVRSKLPFLLLGLTAVVVAVATLVSWGKAIYASWGFTALWGVVAVLGLTHTLRRRLWRRPMVFGLHLSLIVILLGALLTRLTGHKGMLHLRQGIPVSAYETENGEHLPLPALMRLDTFRIVFYPGTEAPQDYVSRVTAGGQVHTISMNRIARLDGYRFYQSSYDEDGQGTILSVNYDPWGTPVTYLGYGLFLLSFLGTLWAPRRKRLRVLLPGLLLAALPARAAGLPTITREKADSLERLPVMWNNRPCPAGTMARDFLQKVHGSSTYRGLTAMQVVASWTLAPQAWNSQPIIKVKGRRHQTLNDFVDYTGPTPRLRGMGQDAATDERVALVLMLQQGTLAQPVPPEVDPLSEHRITLELLYNRVPWAVGGIVLCALAAGVALLRRRGMDLALRSVIFLFLGVHFVLRWYLSGHIPLANTYDTLHLIALGLLPVLPLGSAATLMVAWLVERNPQITPLMPVLHSPWLSAHVTTIMLSYTLLVVSFFRREALRYAVSLLAVGIFLGAVWANVSWGAYWSWDPKEAWALVTLIVYSLPLHTQSLPWFRSTRNYRIYSLLALATLLMTYLGVNYFLGGMHSYG